MDYVQKLFKHLKFLIIIFGLYLNKQDLLGLLNFDGKQLYWKSTESDIPYGKKNLSDIFFY